MKKQRFQLINKILFETGRIRTVQKPYFSKAELNHLLAWIVMNKKDSSKNAATKTAEDSRLPPGPRNSN